jgi:hypothetical protein
MDMNYYKPLEQRCQHDDTMSALFRGEYNDKDSLQRSSVTDSGETARAVREQITERDRRSYEKWRGTATASYELGQLPFLRFVTSSKSAAPCHFKKFPAVTTYAHSIYLITPSRSIYSL